MGGGAAKHVPVILKLCDKHRTRDVLDYGSARSFFAKAMPFPIREYDPAVREKDALPAPADIVVCTDVMEHIEPDRLDAVLAHLRSLTRMCAYVVISLLPSGKKLPDGRNAHLIVESPEWWDKRLKGAGFKAERWEVGENDVKEAEVRAWLA